MEKAALMALFTQARRRAESGDLGISGQHEIISELEHQGLDSAKAQALLQRLVSAQEIDLTEMERLLDAMERPDDSPFGAGATIGATQNSGTDLSARRDVAAVQGISAVSSILEVVCQITGMGFAAVARVTEDKWFACAVLDRVNFGLGVGGELPIKTTLCDEVRSVRKDIVIDDVQNDPKYAGHHTSRIYGLQSYISVPIILADGSFFGTLCAIDAKPAQLTTGPARSMFHLFADLIARHLDDQMLVDQSRAELAESRQLAELRERFIAILGHDLRNPLAAMQSGLNILSAEPVTDRGQLVLDTMQKSTARMNTLVDSMLDLARGRLGSGIKVDLKYEHELAATLNQIIMEARAAHPAREIHARFTLTGAVLVDGARIGQMLSNLLGNAIVHGSPSRPVRVFASDDDGAFRLSVANHGTPIPKEALPKLFLPFYSETKQPTSKGLGLGLYIALQIALAHGGRLDVSSDETETKFTFLMPIDP
jgi:signal transduction histidine kinase